MLMLTNTRITISLLAGRFPKNIIILYDFTAFYISVTQKNGIVGYLAVQHISQLSMILPWGRLYCASVISLERLIELSPQI